jgi:hypothetical protein
MFDNFSSTYRYGFTMSVEEVNKDSPSQKIHDDDDAIDTPTSKYAEGTNPSTTQPKQESPTLEPSSIAPPEERAGCHQDAWSERSAVLSIERSFDRLSKIDLSVDRACDKPIEFISGWSEYDREWSEEGKNVLVDFAKKNIIQGYGDKRRRLEEDQDAKKEESI